MGPAGLAFSSWVQPHFAQHLDPPVKPAPLLSTPHSHFPPQPHPSGKTPPKCPFPLPVPKRAVSKGSSNLTHFLPPKGS